MKRLLINASILAMVVLIAVLGHGCYHNRRATVSTSKHLHVAFQEHYRNVNRALELMLREHDAEAVWLARELASSEATLLLTMFQLNGRRLSSDGRALRQYLARNTSALWQEIGLEYDMDTVSRFLSVRREWSTELLLGSDPPTDAHRLFGNINALAERYLRYERAMNEVLPLERRRDIPIK